MVILISFDYDDGVLISSLNRMGEAVTLAYTDYDRLETFVDAQSQTTSYEWDNQGIYRQLFMLTSVKSCLALMLRAY